MLNQDGTPRRHALVAALWALLVVPISSLAETPPDPRLAIELARAVTVEVTVTQQLAGGRRIEFGAGCVIHPNGLVATTLHTVDRPGTINIRLPDDSLHSAEIVSTFRDLDVAILKWRSTVPHPSIRITPRRDAAAGQAVVAGIPQRGERSLRLAQVNAAPSDVKYRLVSRSTRIISFEADITLGFSGGPVVDLNGELVGIVLARNSNGLRRGYCLPADELLTAMGVDTLAGYPLPASEQTLEAASAVAATAVHPRIASKAEVSRDRVLSDDFSPATTLSSELRFEAALRR